MKTWFIADLHLGHTNIIKYENRPFADVEEMNKTIVKRWNEVVGKDDIVWLLGDIGLGNKEQISTLIKQLRGRKRLIKGNHDNWSDQTYRDMGFEYVSKYPIILKKKFILSHAPLTEQMSIDKDKTFYYIYGHVHSHPAFENQTENTTCVSIERWNYYPIRIKAFDNAPEPTTKNISASSENLV